LIPGYNFPLCEAFPVIFDICHAQDWTFEKVLNCGFIILFRRRLSSELVVQWEHIKLAAAQIDMLNLLDGVVGSLTANKLFSTK
jgi:hypothetical protein